MAATAASATTAQATAQTNTAYSTSTSSSGSSGSSSTYVSTDREGGASYGVVVSNGGSKFAPNVEVVVQGNSNNNN